MGLLDDMGPLLRGKPKVMPGMDFGLPDIAPGVGKSPMDFGIADLAKPPGADQQRSMDFALDDIAPSAQAPGPAMGPTGKIASQLGEGSKVLPPQAEPPGMPSQGLLAANVPLPPSRPAGLGGMPSTRSAAAVPLPPPRPAGLGGPSEIATAPPMPPPRPPGLGIEASGGMMASAPPIAPPAPIAPPIAPPPVAPTAVAGGLGGAAGGAAGGLGGLGSALGGIAKAIQGKPGPPPPEAKAPQIAPSNIGAEVSQTQAAAKAQAPQIMQGLLAPAQNNTLDPRKRRLA